MTVFYGRRRVGSKIYEFRTKIFLQSEWHLFIHEDRCNDFPRNVLLLVYKITLYNFLEHHSILENAYDELKSLVGLTFCAMIDTMKIFYHPSFLKQHFANRFCLHLKDHKFPKNPITFSLLAKLVWTHLCQQTQQCSISYLILWLEEK